MENAADALKMAGAVLLFVLAISIAIFYFGQVRQTADTILSQKDKETKYVYYVTTEGEYKERISLNQVWELLEENGFLKIERAYLVNAKHILKLEGNKLFLSDQSQLSISRYRLKEVKLDIAKYWGGR